MDIKNEQGGDLANRFLEASGGDAKKALLLACGAIEGIRDSLQSPPTGLRVPHRIERKAGRRGAPRKQGSKLPGPYQMISSNRGTMTAARFCLAMKKGLGLKTYAETARQFYKLFGIDPDRTEARNFEKRIREQAKTDE